MAARPDDTDRDAGTERGRYAAVTLDDESVIIYDRNDESAWIQSATAVEREAMR